MFGLQFSSRINAYIGGNRARLMNTPFFTGLWIRLWLPVMWQVWFRLQLLLKVRLRRPSRGWNGQLRKGKLFYPKLAFLLLFLFRSAVAKQYNENKSYKMLYLRFGVNCPPASTVRSWSRALQAGRQVLKPGRPCNLTAAEEDNVMAASRLLRAKGLALLHQFHHSLLFCFRCGCGSWSSHAAGYIGNETYTWTGRGYGTHPNKVLGYFLPPPSPLQQAQEVYHWQASLHSGWYLSRQWVEGSAWRSYMCSWWLWHWHAWERTSSFATKYGPSA